VTAGTARVIERIANVFGRSHRLAAHLENNIAGLDAEIGRARSRRYRSR